MPPARPTKPNEAEVELRVLLPLFADLGYASADIAPKHPVRFQEGKKGRNAEADFVLMAGSASVEDTAPSRPSDRPIRERRGNKVCKPAANQDPNRAPSHCPERLKF